MAVYPQGTSVDIVLRNGARLANVQVMRGEASDASGRQDLIDVGGPSGEQRWVLTSAFERYVRAVISYIGQVPICLGFVFPQVSQMTFDRKNFRVDRHGSDVYSTINDSGDIEQYHPSGTFLRIASSPTHEDLTGQDFDQQWAIERNTSAAVYVNLTVANAGSVVATFEIDPAGNVSLVNAGNLTAKVGGDIDISAGGDLDAEITGTTTITSGGAATLKAPSVTIDSPTTTCTGTLTVQGALTFQAGATGSAGSGGGAAISLTGDVSVTGGITSTGDQVAGNISQINHEHTSENPGSPTSPPIA
ncbi:hypothetical protein D7S86_27005 [Pararobbsia silviterrae]|uniref:Phage baseplate assembly protein V n=1 Tax=Pararobbsia silviterrae TaxID=1792498 RepID=A0A494X2U3_9BURK|nr:hypothetical protein D7S86_27005 [Pararobbsia silviterrae]